MRIPFSFGSFSALTDNTAELDSDTIFLKTAQNTPYFESLEHKPEFLTPPELIALWGLEALRVVGITGTNGKTTTTAAIYSLLLDLGYKAALQGTRGLYVNDKRVEEKSMTTPSILQTLCNMKRAKEAQAEFFVMEVSSHAIDQQRIEGIEFALKVHTNVTSDHLDYHGSVEEYRRVKSAFFADGSLKLLNKDAIETITYNPQNARSYGVDQPATYKVQAFSLKAGIHAVVSYLGEQASFSSPMQGLFNLFNLTAAVASVHMLTQKPLQEVCDAVEHFGGVSGRMEVVSTDPLVIVDFAHTADGMAQVLDAMKDRDIVVVFGAGGERDKKKRPEMGRVAARYAKRIFVTSDNPRSEVPEMIIEDILKGLIGAEDRVTAVLDRRLAIRMALESLQKGEVLMVLGKGDESYQEIAGKKIPFDDREVVRELLS